MTSTLHHPQRLSLPNFEAIDDEDDFAILDDEEAPPKGVLFAVLLPCLALDAKFVLLLDVMTCPLVPLPVPPPPPPLPPPLEWCVCITPPASRCCLAINPFCACINATVVLDFAPRNLVPIEEARE